MIYQNGHLSELFWKFNENVILDFYVAPEEKNFRKVNFKCFDHIYVYYLHALSLNFKEWYLYHFCRIFPSLMHCADSTKFAEPKFVHNWQ